MYVVWMNFFLWKTVSWYAEALLKTGVQLYYKQWGGGLTKLLYIYILMGICITQYRLTIGYFNACKFVTTGCVFSMSCLSLNIMFILFVLVLLSTISGDVELNPGPNVRQLCKRLSVYVMVI
jgi:uncharacterized membrane protein YhdT